MRPFIKRLFRWLFIAIGLSIPLTALAISASNPNSEQVITPLQDEAAFNETHREVATMGDPYLEGHPHGLPLHQLQSSEEATKDIQPYTQEEVIQLIHHWAEYFNVPVEHPLRIAKCESNYRWDAKNNTSSASGVFQFLNGTWANTFEGQAGASVFDANANITAAIRHMSVHGYDAWECK